MHIYIYVDLKPKISDVKIFTADSTHPDGWGTILIGGTTKGNAESLRKFIRNIVAESKKSASEETHDGSND